MIEVIVWVFLGGYGVVIDNIASEQECAALRPKINAHGVCVPVKKVFPRGWADRDSEKR